MQFRLREVQMTHQPAELLLQRRFGAMVRIAAEQGNGKQERQQAFTFGRGGCGWMVDCDGGPCTGLANQLIESNRDRLTEVHGGVFRSRRDSQKKVAVIHVLIG